MIEERSLVSETPDEDPREIEYASDVLCSAKIQVTVEDSKGRVLKQETIDKTAGFEITIPFLKRWRVSSIDVSVEKVMVSPKND